MNFIDSSNDLTNSTTTAQKIQCAGCKTIVDFMTVEVNYEGKLVPNLVFVDEQYGYLCEDCSATSS